MTTKSKQEEIAKLLEKSFSYQIIKMNTEIRDALVDLKEKYKS